jgi:hypothetical protein
MIKMGKAKKLIRTIERRLLESISPGAREKFADFRKWFNSRYAGEVVAIKMKIFKDQKTNRAIMVINYKIPEDFNLDRAGLEDAFQRIFGKGQKYKVRGNEIIFEMSY